MSTLKNVFQCPAYYTLFTYSVRDQSVHWGCVVCIVYMYHFINYAL